MKRYISILLAVAILFSFAGCSEVAETLTDDFAEAVEESADELVVRAEESVHNWMDEKKKTVTNWVNEKKEKAKEAVFGQNALLSLPKTGPSECDHNEAAKYDEKQYIVTCKCGIETIAGLSYEEFVGVLSVWQKKSILNPSSWGTKENVYYAEQYLTYCGIDPAYLKLIDKIPKEIIDDKDTVAKLEKLDGVFTALSIIPVFSEVYVEDINGKVKIQSQFPNIVEKKSVKNAGVRISRAEGISNTIEIARALVNLHNLIEDTNDPEAACLDFIAAAGDVIGYAPDHYAVYYTIMLDALRYVLDNFFEAYKNYKFTQEVLNASVLNGDSFVDDWTWFPRQNKWEEYLDYYGIEGTEGIDPTSKKASSTDVQSIDDESVNTERKDFLPSLEEAIAEYDNASDDGKKLLSTYIVFRLDRLFEETLGITYEEFVNCIEG